MIWVKICGTTNLHDARLAVEAGADAVGFVFAESPRRIKPALAATIAAQLPASVEKVGVFANEPPARIRELVQQVGLTAVQLHGSESAAYAEQLFADSDTRPKIYRALSMKTIFSAVNLTASLRGQRGSFDALLVDSGSPGRGGTGETFDWERARPFIASLKKSSKVIVAGGLTPENVARAVRMFQPWGVDVASGVESAPGRKDSLRVRAFVVAARSIR